MDSFFYFFLCLRAKFHKLLFWVPILAAGGPYWVLISQKNGSLLGPYLKAWGSLLVLEAVKQVIIPTFFGVVMVAPLTFSLSVFTSLPFFLAAFSLPSPPSPPLSESSPSFDSSLVEGSVERRTEVREPNATGTDFFFPLRSSSLESWKEEVKSCYYAWNCLNLTWNMEFNRSQLRH